LDPRDDPARAIAELAAAKKPWLYGVRHHSPACASALPPLLDALAPTAVAIELPADLAPWIEWLGHDEAEAPLAIAAVAARGDDLGFYPFADFSPELVAIRWARAHDVPVHAIDLPASRRAGRRRHGGATIGIERRLRAGDDDDTWDGLVERAAAPAATRGPADSERVRRAALLYGWALRVDAARGDGVGEYDLAREQFMREALAPLVAKKGARVAAVIGSFHAAALLPEAALWRAPEDAAAGETVEMVSSLIPYGFELLDERSGYPAGIRDPMWQQRAWQARASGEPISGLVAACLVEITRAIRARGLPASVPDAHAAAEIALSLARLRGLAEPGRRELVEAVQSALAQGELLGRGRVVARAMEQVLVGRKRGALAAATPRSGLAPHVEALLVELRLPHAHGADAEDVRLDPLRSPLDRRRHVALCRLRACGVPYGNELDSQAAGGVETLTAVWRVQRTPATDAIVELAGIRGVTLRQAAAGALRAERARQDGDDKLKPATLVAIAEQAAEAGIGDVARELLVELAGPRLLEATLAELVALVALVDRIAAGHVVGLPFEPAAEVAGEIERFAMPAIDRGAILNAAVASVLGLAGSESLDDARALLELVRILDRPEHGALGDGRLRWAVDELARAATPVISGAAAIVRVLIGTATAEALSDAIGAWLDAAVDADARRVLSGRLRGAIAVAGPLFESAPVFLDGLMARVEQLDDGAFLERAAALREGFDVLSNASRRRLLVVLGDRLGESDARGGGLDVTTELAPEILALAAEADLAGRAAVTRLGLAQPEVSRMRDNYLASEISRRPASADRAIPPVDRWRIILGHERDRMRPHGARAMRALDELYGHGHGEGSRGELGLGGGGQEAAFPTVRAWRDEIEALFGARVFEEVAGKAATAGRVGALLEVDPGQVSPSVELLEQVLSLKGGLGEAHLGRLRALVRRIVDELVRELAVRVRPALHGALGRRATRRPTSTLHLPRTVGANLARARVDGDDVSIVPERLYFRQRSRRHMDWNVVIVVDVSGSMEPSVIYSAMMAAILSGVPWIDVKFIAFSTEVVDLSAHASDPLALLLEVAVGGGTHIAKALRYARDLVGVPQRTIVIVVSDFEEGFAVGALLAEVRALVEAGVHCLGLAALDDRGAPRYAVPIAELVAAAGMPIAALTPLELARWVGDKIR
jgi:hypothetical protein